MYPKICFGCRTIGAKIKKKISKNYLNATKRLIKKAFLKPKLLNFARCYCVHTKIPHFNNLSMRSQSRGKACYQ